MIETMNPDDDDDCGYMGEEIPEDYDYEWEPEEDYYPRSLYGN